MHSATYLSTASIAIIAYADRNPWSQAYGVMLLPIALGFIVYAMVNCKWGGMLCASFSAVSLFYLMQIVLK